MNPVRDMLERVVSEMDASNASVTNLTYDQVCRTLKFYCGFNPKTAEGIKSRIANGLPSLKNVSVQMTQGGLNPIVRFTMTDGTQRTFRYC